MEASRLTPTELKGERPAPTTASQFGRLVGAVAVLVIAANYVAGAAVDHWSPNRGYLVLKTKWKDLLALERPVDWLVLGDSSANQGVDPAVLEHMLGGRAINLATIADTLAVNDAWMLQTYVERFGAPRAVVVVHTYDMWDRSLREALMAEVPLDWGYWNRLQPRIDTGPVRLMKVAAHRYAPLYTHQDSLIMLLRGWTSGAPPTFTDEGFMPVDEADVAQVDEDYEEHVAATRDHQFTMSADNSQALAELGVLAVAHNVPIVLVNAPLYDRLYRVPHFRRYYEQVNVALNAWALSAPGRHFVMQTPMRFPRTMMENADHLTSRGAALYSAALADELALIAHPPCQPGAVRGDCAPAGAEPESRSESRIDPATAAN